MSDRTRRPPPGKLGGGAVEAGQVGERQRADGQVEATVRERQRLGRRLAQLYARKAASRHLQHLGRAVHPDHLMARGSEVGSVASGAASRIERARAAPGRGRP